MVHTFSTRNVSPHFACKIKINKNAHAQYISPAILLRFCLVETRLKSSQIISQISYDSRVHFLEKNI